MASSWGNSWKTSWGSSWGNILSSILGAGHRKKKKHTEEELWKQHLNNPSWFPPKEEIQKISEPLTETVEVKIPAREITYEEVVAEVLKLLPSKPNKTQIKEKVQQTISYTYEKTKNNISDDDEETMLLLLLVN